MKFKRCEFGHYYDPSKYDRCPHCFARSSGVEAEYTVAKRPVDERVMQAYDLDDYDAPAPSPRAAAAAPVAPAAPAAPAAQAAPQPAERPAAPAAPAAPAPMPEAEDSVTVARLARDTGINPPVGWLVQITGANKGKAYEVHAERNTIGRSSSMDICLKGDLGVSRDTNGVLSYNPRNRSFHLIPGEGKAILYVNGQELLSPQELNAYDCIEISETALLFVPLCGERFAWEDLKDD